MPVSSGDSRGHWRSCRDRPSLSSLLPTTAPTPASHRAARQVSRRTRATPRQRHPPRPAPTQPCTPVITPSSPLSRSMTRSHSSPLSRTRTRSYRSSPLSPQFPFGCPFLLDVYVTINYSNHVYDVLLNLDSFFWVDFQTICVGRFDFICDCLILRCF